MKHAARVIKDTGSAGGEFITLHEAAESLRVYQHNQTALYHNTGHRQGSVDNKVYLELSSHHKLHMINDVLHTCTSGSCRFLPFKGYRGEYRAHLFATFYHQESMTTDEHIHDILKHIEAAWENDDRILAAAPWVAELFIIQCSIFPICHQSSMVSTNAWDDISIGKNEYSIKKGCISFMSCHWYRGSPVDVNRRQSLLYRTHVGLFKDGTLVELEFSLLETRHQEDDMKKCFCRYCRLYLKKIADQLPKLPYFEYWTEPDNILHCT
jgi:hypothetical protein